MSVRVSPQFSVFETIEATMDVDKYGFATARVSYYARTADEVVRILKTGKECPLIAAGMMRSARFLHGNANSEECDVWKVTLFWKGISSRLRLNEASVPRYRPIAQTAPIDTHPDFAKFAGTPRNRLNGAQFDEHDSFTRFQPKIGGVKNKKAGVTSYYQAMLKVGETRGIKQTDAARLALWNKVGKICSPDVRAGADIKLPVSGMTAERNYLLVSITLEDMGQGYALLDRDWDMSGPFGWDPDIYEYAQ